MWSCRICWHTTRKRANIIRHLKLIHDITDHDGKNATKNSNKTVETTSDGNDSEDCVDTISPNCSTFTNLISRHMNPGMIDARSSMTKEYQQGTNSHKRQCMMDLQNGRLNEEDDRQKPSTEPEENGDRIGAGLKAKKLATWNTVLDMHPRNLIPNAERIRDTRELNPR